MNRNALRRLLRDPAPLPADASPWLDERSKAFYEEAVDGARFTMALHDRSPAPVRALNTIAGNIGIARRLFAQGHRTVQAAEQEVRRLLSSPRYRTSPHA